MITDAFGYPLRILASGDGYRTGDQDADFFQAAAERRKTVSLQCFHIGSECIQIGMQQFLRFRVDTEIGKAGGAGTKLLRIGAGQEIQAAADNGKAKAGSVSFAGGKNATDFAAVTDNVVRPLDGSWYSTGADGVRHGQGGAEGEKTGIPK